ncbi:cytochrome P450 78A5-like protein, partial [Tanacetum coccineum]
MIFRGTDTVAILLEWIMARMVLHQDIQAKAQDEIDEHVGNRHVQDSDISKLVYLQAIVKEVLRMHPPGPLLSWARLPERFIEEEVPVMGSDLRLAPFGSGRRVCPGKSLGLATVHLWLARLLQQYKWLPSTK